MLKKRLPSRGPNRSKLMSHTPIALDTTANEKIVFAKSYSAHDAGTIARPDGVSAPSPLGCGWDATPDDPLVATGR
jgi:hypothetical protein